MSKDKTIEDIASTVSKLRRMRGCGKWIFEMKTKDVTDLITNEKIYIPGGIILKVLRRSDDLVHLIYDKRIEVNERRALSFQEYGNVIDLLDYKERMRGYARDKE